MTWFSKYRFTLTHPTAGTRVVTPVIDDINIPGKQESRFVWRKALAAGLLFAKDDFQWLHAIEGGAGRCDKTEVLIEVSCGGSWETMYNGFTTMDGGRWFPRSCRVILKVSIDDEYTCIFEGWKEEKNILEVSPSYTITGLGGYAEEVECGPDLYNDVALASIPENDTCLPDANAWTLLNNYFAGTLETSPGVWRGNLTTVWVRERMDDSPTQPGGDGWISIGGDSWVRTIGTVFTGETIDASSTLQEWELTQDFSFDNGRLLEDVLDFLNPCTGTYTIQSDFLRINAGVLPVTDPYDAAEAGFTAIMVWQKSDIVRPNADYNATKGVTTFEKVLDWLRKMFNMEWRVEGSVIRIEHLSYFEGSEGLDLTLPPYDDQIENKTSYQYNQAKKPQYERFSWMDPVTALFAGDPIVYDTGCTDKESNSEAFIRLEEVTTDISYANLNADGMALQGFVFGAVYINPDDNYYLNQDNSQINGHLSWTNLHDNYYRHGRPQLTGNMNGTDETFESAYPSKEQEILAIQIECSEFLGFNPGDLVQTQLGWGEVMSWEYSAKKCQLTLQISHQ